MAFDFAKAKRTARQVVHKTLGVSALYQDSSLSAPVPCVCRYHTKAVNVGDLNNEGYAVVASDIEQVVFEADVARTIGVKRGGHVTLLAMGAVINSDLVLTLDSKAKPTGPFKEVWNVVSGD